MTLKEAQILSKMAEVLGRLARDNKDTLDLLSDEIGSGYHVRLLRDRIDNAITDAGELYDEIQRLPVD